MSSNKADPQAGGTGFLPNISIGIWPLKRSGHRVQQLAPSLKRIVHDQHGFIAELTDVGKTHGGWKASETESFHDQIPGTYCATESGSFIQRSSEVPRPFLGIYVDHLGTIHGIWKLRARYKRSGSADENPAFRSPFHCIGVRTTVAVTQDGCYPPYRFRLRNTQWVSRA